MSVLIHQVLAFLSRTLPVELLCYIDALSQIPPYMSNIRWNNGIFTGTAASLATPVLIHYIAAFLSLALPV